MGWRDADVNVATREWGIRHCARLGRPDRLRAGWLLGSASADGHLPMGHLGCRRAKLHPARSATLRGCLNFRVLLPTLATLFHERHDLVVENLLLRHQLQIALRSRPRPHIKSWDRFFWLVVRQLYQASRRHLVLVRPETVLRWHRRGWRLYWRWRSGRHLGRPRLSSEIRELIDTMASHNPLWGTERIPWRAPQARHRRQLPLDPPLSSTRHTHPPSQSWRTFLANHAQAIGAADLLSSRP
jgi:hypothetical protein